MSRIYFIPTNDAEYRKNHGIYAALIAAPDSVYVAKYDIAPATVAQISADDAQLTTANALINSLRAQLTKAEGDYEALKSAVTARWTTEAGDIKRDSDFIDSDGEALKILGPETVNDLAAKNPGLRLEITPEGVKINFTKSGADGINLYCQRAGDEKMVLVRFLSKTGWVDARPNLVAGQDESRQYAAYLVKNDIEVGQVSLPAPISVRPRA